MTTALILLPAGGALVVWLLPWSRYWAGSFGLLVALAEVGLWIETLIRFNFSHPGVQLEDRARWFGDLGISYHVGLYGFSLWLIGMSVVVMAASIAYAFWTGRERARAYFGLELFLTGAIVGVFAAQDLLLFYAFFEAMLIPLYVLVGVWGGPGRMAATLKFVLYTMAGSLLMLAAGGGFGVLPATVFPLHGWLPDAYRESSPEVAAVLAGVVSKAAAYGFLRIAVAKFPQPAHDFRVPILALAAVGLVYGSLLAFRAPDVRGVVAYS